ncbi:putative acetyltransferase [Chitinivorax tropicus]|uniref:Putative acetyltransferase n=1 Tax=Chitinivorax tropicus TaxID=714531 RepID=A0A840MMH9_9PROT|nr:GNAT family N-acetyltransferase [Chitinivorax tropicus]MBB5018329.1 putative acetyltransferase [Chitinivorax tropicus]
MLELLHIRRAEIQDAKALTALFEQPAVHRHMLQQPYPIATVWQDFLQPSLLRHVLVAECDSQVVGEIMLDGYTNPARKHVASIAMAVHTDFQGQGVGSRLMTSALDLADNWLNLQRLELQVFCRNEPAIALYKKHGFEIEGTLRRHAFRAGQFLDAYWMARVR